MAEGVVAGIDWASEVHVACVLDRDGAVAGRFSFTHDAAAIRAMVRRLRSAGVARVAIERGDGPVVEELLAAGLAVFVVPSRQIKGLRTRYGSAGNKDDRFDAYVLADTLRTDGHRWKPLRPDTEATRAPGPGPGVPRRDRPVHQACQRDQPGVLAPLPDLGQGSVTVPGPPRRLAAVSRLYRRRPRHSAARPPDGRGAGTGRRRG
jgi:Transposase